MTILKKILKTLTCCDLDERDGKIASALQRVKHRKKNASDEAVELDVRKARKISLPKLKFEKKPLPEDNIQQDWVAYWNRFNKGCSLYRRKSYLKAKEEFLKIYRWHHRSPTFYTNLLRAYRKIAAKYIEKNKYDSALAEIQEMFENCPNVTNTDVKNYNKVIDILHQRGERLTCSKKGLLPVSSEPEIIIKSSFIELVNEYRKPSKFRFQNAEAPSIVRLKDYSIYLPSSLPYIGLNGYYDQAPLAVFPSLKHGVYRFAESAKRDAFIASSEELDLYVYDWNLNLMHSMDVSKYSAHKYHLREVNLSSDLTCFLFTNVNKAYLLDSAFQVLAIWQVPHKEGWEKRKIGVERSSSDKTMAIQYQNLLRVTSNSSKEEIKSSFRRLAHKYHPDKNPDNPLATSKMRQIIEAYECLTREDVAHAFKGLEDEEYWVNTLETIKFDVMGIEFELSISVGSGEDWIYGSGISNDGSRIYLGCYSGKTYKVLRNAMVEKIYVAPEDKNGKYGKTNPICYISERDAYLHILSHWFLYILKDDKTLKAIKVDEGDIKWFDYGFVYRIKNTIEIYSNSGSSIGSITLRDKIRHICFIDNKFLLVSNKKCYVAKLNISDLDIFS